MTHTVWSCDDSCDGLESWLVTSEIRIEAAPSTPIMKKPFKRPHTAVTSSIMTSTIMTSAAPTIVPTVVSTGVVPSATVIPTTVIPTTVMQTAVMPIQTANIPINATVKTDCKTEDENDNDSSAPKRMKICKIIGYMTIFFKVWSLKVFLCKLFWK